MIRMAKQARLKPEENIVSAVISFGQKGERLEERERNQCCAYFEGGGCVAISIADERKTRNLDIETREFEYQAKRFLKTL